MADDTYMPLVYMMQGGDEQVIASGGTVTVEGDINVESGGAINIASGGSLSFNVSGTTVSGPATLTEFAADGVSFITSSGDTRKFSITAPYLGAHKYLFQSAGTTGMVMYYSAGSGVGIVTTGGDSTAHMMINDGTTAGAESGWCHLVGLSTSRWLRVAHSPTTQWVIASTSS